MGQIKHVKGKIIFKHETEADWLSSSYVPSLGEKVLYDPDENHSYTRIKYGDGKTIVKELPFSGIDMLNIENSENGGIQQSGQNNINHTNGVTFGGGNIILGGAKKTYVGTILTDKEHLNAQAIYVSSTPNNSPLIGEYMELIDSGRYPIQDQSISFYIEDPKNRDVILVKGSRVYLLQMNGGLPFAYGDAALSASGDISGFEDTEGECYFYLPGYPDQGVEEIQSEYGFTTGYGNKVLKSLAYAGGLNSTAAAEASFSFGIGTTTHPETQCQVAVGKYNKETTALFIVGKGNNEEDRENAFEVTLTGIKIGDTVFTEEQLAKLIQLLDTIEI